VTLSYVDVVDAAHPSVFGTSRFGQGWAWTPAAGTFKAFTLDASRALVVLPFSGWSNTSYTYTNGLQLIEVTDSTIRTAGPRTRAAGSSAASSSARGWSPSPTSRCR
jgi:hypothetical protein